MLDTILFDLDGTLLRVDTDKFLEIYFTEMGMHFKDLIHPKQMMKNVLESVGMMMSNLESQTNETVFTNHFKRLIDRDFEEFRSRIDSFYDQGFLKVREATAEEPLIKKSIEILKEKKYDLILATNPIYPRKAILHRIGWAGLSPSDFSHIPSYEEYCYCKPQKEYFSELLGKTGKAPEQCLMVGNDVQEDGAASKLGIKVFFVTDYLDNKDDGPIKADYMGTYRELYDFIKSLPSL